MTSTIPRWFHDVPAWDGSLPAAFALAGKAAPDPRRGLAEVVARALRLDAADVAIEHAADARPRLVRPPASGLFLSLARRGGFGALAVARAPVGVDVEEVGAAGDIPWNVLHRGEARFLRACPAAEVAAAFARLWCVKEAYVKALGSGFLREPASFQAVLDGGEAASILDPEAEAPVAAASTQWREAGGRRAAFACVVLAAG